MGLSDLFKPAGLDYANEMTERNLNRVLSLGQESQTAARGIYGQQREGMLASLRESTGAIGAGVAASAEELRDQQTAFLGQLMASKGGSMLNPGQMMAALTAQNVKGLRSVYGGGSQARAANIINTEQMNQQALAGMGQSILAGTTSQQQALSNVRHEIGSSPWADLMGAAGTGIGIYGAFGGFDPE